MASVGNPEACFLTDLRPVFLEGRRSLTPPMECLERSGHKLGMYMYALMLYKSNTSAGHDDIAWGLLKKLEGADVTGLAALPWKNWTFMLCRQDVHQLLQRMVPQGLVPIRCPVLP
jgi:hypothetical protein